MSDLMRYPIDRQKLANTYAQEGLKRLTEAPDQAVVYFQTAVALKPEAETFYELSKVHLSLGHLDFAERAAAAALEIDPKHPGALTLLGAVLSQLGRFSAALPFFRSAAELLPTSAQAQHNLALVELQVGDLDTARAQFLRALEIESSTKGTLYFANRLIDMGDGSEHARRLSDKMSALAARCETLSDQLRIELFYSLAKAHDDLGDAQSAFNWMRKGADLQRATLAYDGAAHVRRLRRVTEAFDSELMSKLAGQGLSNDRPIFIVGMPKSGSTLVEQIISSHRHVLGAGELTNFPNMIENSRGSDGGRFPEWGTDMIAQDCANLARAYLNSLPPASADELHMTDKNLANFEYLGLIHLCLPNARIIHVRRDPRDVALSCYAILFEGQEWSYSFEDLARYWLAHEQLMDHWNAVLPPDRILQVSYEKLVANLEPQTRRILDYCGLEWDPGCLNFHQSSRGVASSAAHQVRRPIYTTSIGRWRRYAEPLAPLFKAMGLSADISDNVVTSFRGTTVRVA